MGQVTSSCGKKSALVAAVIASSAALFGSAGSASAAPVDAFPGGTVTVNQQVINIGHEFAVTGTGITVDALGVYDGQAAGGATTGLVQSHVVTLFSISNFANNPTTTTALESITVPAGTGPTLLDNTRFLTTSPLFLPAGNYAVIAYGLDNGNGTDSFGNGSLNTTGSNVTFKQDAYQFSGGASPAFPTGGDTNNHASASILFDNGNTVPEPATASLLAVGTAGLLARRRRA